MNLKKATSVPNLEPFRDVSITTGTSAYIYDALNEVVLVHENKTLEIFIEFNKNPMKFCYTYEEFWNKYGLQIILANSDLGNNPKDLELLKSKAANWSTLFPYMKQYFEKIKLGITWNFHPKFKIRNTKDTLANARLPFWIKWEWIVSFYCDYECKSAGYDVPNEDLQMPLLIPTKKK